MTLEELEEFASRAKEGEIEGIIRCGKPEFIHYPNEYFEQDREDAEYTSYEYKDYPQQWDTPTPLFSVLEYDVMDNKIRIICCIGNWLISEEGDILFDKWGKGKRDEVIYWDEDIYPIYSNQLQKDDWILRLSEEAWFTTEVYKDFKRAYFVACRIAGVTPAKQIREYPNKH